MHTDGTGQARLSDYPGELPTGLFWSPDSEKIAFEIGAFGRPRDIHVVNADGSGLKNLTSSSADERFLTEGHGGYKVWSADSEMITFFRETGTVGSYGPGSGESPQTVGKELVVDADGTGEPVEATDVHPSCPWPSIPGSTDEADLVGRFVGFQFTPTHYGGEYEFYRSAVLAASEWPSVESPDGTMILQISGPFDGQGDYDIHLSVGCVPNVKAPGCRTYLTNTQAVNEYDAVWSPDGKKFAFTSAYGGNRDIHVMNIDGTGRRNLTRSAALDGPVLR
jgi:WD40 repeat protein